ncbi:KRAB-A domain-containing protein 2-like isoform X1 [Centruroides vittatus]|uniref:KRAB-A domain-containing protein 2-like isoform X1 n=1 Tax=Centruroides vittatus TaxID=120091 RepID=UPI00350EE980
MEEILPESSSNSDQQLKASDYHDFSYQSTSQDMYPSSYCQQNEICVYKDEISQDFKESVDEHSNHSESSITDKKPECQEDTQEQMDSSAECEKQGSVSTSVLDDDDNKTDNTILSLSGSSSQERQLTELGNLQNQRDSNQGTQWKEEFLKRIIQIDKHEKKEDHYNVMTKESYDKLMDEIEEAQLAEKKTQKQHRRLNRFKVINICGTRKLVTRKEPMRYYLYVDEIFDIVEATHVAIGHGGRDRLKIETSRKYANITKEMINIFLSMCKICQRKKSMKKMGLVSKPLLCFCKKKGNLCNSKCHVSLPCNNK